MFAPEVFDAVGSELSIALVGDQQAWLGGRHEHARAPGPHPRRRRAEMLLSRRTIS
jgi:hypothetical protein